MYCSEISAAFLLFVTKIVEKYLEKSTFTIAVLIFILSITVFVNMSSISGKLSLVTCVDSFIVGIIPNPSFESAEM